MVYLSGKLNNHKPKTIKDKHEPGNTYS
jgi:hypothetical protein